MKAEVTPENEVKMGQLKRAEEASVKEQDIYREIIDKHRKKGNKGDIASDVQKGGVFRLHSVMRGCKCPPDVKDRRSLLNIEKNECYIDKELKKISDKRVRAGVYFLNEVIEHTQRIRSMAVFSERVGPLIGPGEELFSLWAKRTVADQLINEAKALKKKEAEDLLLSLVSVLDGLMDLQLEHWPQTIDFGSIAHENLDCGDNKV